MIKRVLLLCVAVGLSLLATPASRAAQLSVDVISEVDVRVQLEFYSENRDHAWPGGDDAYNIDDYARHSYLLNCHYGEKICMGAWVNGNSSRYWGVGLNNKHSCAKCCFVCGSGDYPVQVLDN